VRIARFVRLATVACVAVMLAVECGGQGGKRGLTVTSQVVSDSATRDLRVLAPQDEGTWPVVVALHGVGGSGEDMVELATRLATAGAVVFAPTYHSDLTTTEGLLRAGDDISCAYQLARRAAPELGGDLTQPVTAVGWSLGADFVLLGSLQEPAGETGRCPGQVPRPDVVVGLSGCYYEFEGQPVNWFDDVTSWRTTGADIYLVEGERDTVCPAWQTEKLAGALRAAGHRVELVELNGANHYAPVFHDERNGQWQVITDDPAGDQTVQIILDAIAAARDALPVD
jgi:dienelactone hydrolase